MFYQLTKFQYQTYFPSQEIKHNVFLNSCLDNDKVRNFDTIQNRGGKGEGVGVGKKAPLLVFPL